MRSSLTMVRGLQMAIRSLDDDIEGDIEGDLMDPKDQIEQPYRRGALDEQVDVFISLEISFGAFQIGTV